MRVFVPAVAVAGLMAAPAFAAEWNEYRYPELGFAIEFPGVPMPDPSGGHAYVLNQDGIEYRVTVTDIADRNPDKERLIDEVVDATRAMGTVEVESRPRVDREYGRAVVVAGRDGNRYSNVVFLVGQRLYQLAATYKPPHPTSGYVMRFQMSFRLLP